MQPNLVPPIKSTEMALLYKAQLQAIDPSVDYMMTLYLSPELTPEEIRKAKAAGVAGTSLLFAGLHRQSYTMKVSSHIRAVSQPTLMVA